MIIIQPQNPQTPHTTEREGEDSASGSSWREESLQNGDQEERKETGYNFKARNFTGNITHTMSIRGSGKI